MKNKLLLLLIFLFSQSLISQAQTDEILPRGFSKSEKIKMAENNFHTPTGFGATDPPPGPVRTMAEWEELDALIITWSTGSTGITNILREIVRHAKEEVQVVIVCSSQALVTNLLAGVGINTDNIIFVQDDFDSIWVRDYGPNTVYLNDVEQQYFIDWIYNRPRPEDDEVVPGAVASQLNIPLYVTDNCGSDLDLVHTGGNFMADGMGTGFSSKLILDENGNFNQFGCNTQSESEIKDIMDQYMGIDRYILMEKLIYDPIDHIDMHMKLLDEETLLVGKYPDGVADGPQIEANLQYVLDNYQTPFGNEYDVVRIEMPPHFGSYPDNNGNYRTYANAVFVNKTVLLPIYEEQFDTTAIRIWEEALPGYNIQGINCNAIIGLNGAIHCITKEVGTAEPLLIQTARVREGCMLDAQNIEAIIKHKSGIQSATLFYTTDTLAGYQNLAMANTSENNWSASIPATNEITEMYYYIHAVANDGKEISRPLVAPVGHFKYGVKDCEGTSTEDDLEKGISLDAIYPNPASAITVIPVTTSENIYAEIVVTDILGRTVETIFSGNIPVGENNYFLHADKYSAGAYFVNLKTEKQSLVQKLIVK